MLAGADLGAEGHDLLSGLAPIADIADLDRSDPVSCRPGPARRS